LKSRLFQRLATAGALATSAVVLLGGVAHATPTGQAPQFFTPTVNQFRATGSETTYYVMNAVGNLFSQASIYGCTLNTVDYRTCTQSDGSATDIKDNWSRNEFINGEGIGTGNGIGQLCGSKATGGLTVDFARGSRAPNSGDNCPTAVPLQFAADSVVGVVFPFLNTGTITCTGTCTTAQTGPPAAGWRTGDPVGGPYTGIPFANVDNTASTILGESQAAAIYCDKTGPHAINDWGQLNDATIDTTTGKTKGSEGIGTVIGVPIYIPFVNTGSGTYSTWKTFVGCDPNTKNTDAQTAQENDAPQLGDIAVADHGSDNIAASNQIAASLYYISYGVSQWRGYTYGSELPGRTPIPGKLTKINNLAASQGAELAKTIATVRGLYNIYLPTKVRASMAGFLNYLCDTDAAHVNHGIDLTTGINYASELGNTIGTQFVFPQVPCAVDGGGNSVPPITAAMVTDFNS
jgi:ABC-type phosphate transport system substrate-binding protein